MADPLTPPLRDRYLIVEPIGQGGMGTVHMGYDIDLERRVAIKQVSARRAPTERALKRFRREAAAMARVNHPNVVSVYDVVETDDDVFVVMELVWGDTLREWLGATRRSAPEILGVFQAAGRGLAEIHARGLVHRDFKPANVLMAEHGRPRVTDFGLASLVGEDELETDPHGDASSSSPGQSLTETGTVLGTPRYMAPEQHKLAPVDHRADQYAFCVALWEALSLRPPFTPKSLDGLAKAKAKGLPKSVRLRASPRIEAVIRRGLAPDPRARFGSMVELLRALERAVTRRGRAAVAAVVVAAGAAGLGVAAAAGAPNKAGCADAEAALEVAWGDARRTALTAHLADAAPRITPETATSVVDAIERRAEQWRDGYRRACAIEDTAARDRNLACLAARRASLAGTLDVVEAGGPGVLIRGRQLIDKLDAAGDCEQSPALQLTEDLEQAVARVEASNAAGEFANAIAEGESVLGQLACATVPSACARVYAALGRARSGVGQADRAVEDLEEAYALGMSAGRDEAAARVALALSDQLAARAVDPRSARRWLDHARALAERSRSPGLRASVHVGEAWLLIAAGDGERARSESETAVALCLEEHKGDEAPCWYELHTAAGATDTTSNHHGAEALMERALAGAEATLGADHPSTTAVRGNLANIKRNVGKNFEASELTAQVVIAFERAHGPAHHHTLRAKAEHAMRLLTADRRREAKGLIEEAFAVTETDPYTRAVVLKAKASVERDAGFLADATRHLLASMEIATELYGAESPKLFDEWVQLAEIERDLGKFDVAAEHLDRASALAPAGPASRSGIELEKAKLRIAVGDADGAKAAVRRAEGLAVGLPTAATNAWAIVDRLAIWTEIYRLEGQREAARSLATAGLAVAYNAALVPDHVIADLAIKAARVELDDRDAEAAIAILDDGFPYGDLEDLPAALQGELLAIRSLADPEDPAKRSQALDKLTNAEGQSWARAALKRKQR